MPYIELFLFTFHQGSILPLEATDSLLLFIATSPRAYSDKVFPGDKKRADETERKQKNKKYTKTGTPGLSPTMLDDAELQKHSDATTSLAIENAELMRRIAELEEKLRRSREETERERGERMRLEADSAERAAATEDLVRVFDANPTSPDLAAVKEAVRRGANVMVRHKNTCPLLSYLIYNEALDAAEACLSSPHSIDFTLGDRSWLYRNCTCLHYMAAFDESNPPRILTALLDRLEKYPQLDRIDWGATDTDGDTCLSVAALKGQLSTWWAVLKKRQVPYFMQQDVFFLNASDVETKDFEKVPLEDRERFRLL